MSNKYTLGRTKWLRYSWLLVVAFLFSQSAQAQISAYSFSSSAGTYTPLVGGTVLNTATRTFDDNSYNALPIGFNFNYNGTVYTTVSANSNGFIEMGNTASSSTAALTARPNAIVGLNRDLASGFALAGNRTIGSPDLSAVINTSGALPGMVISTSVGGWTAGTATILSTTASTVTMSSNATGATTATNHAFNFNGTATQNPSQISYLTTGAVGSRVFTIEFHRVKRFGTTVANVNGDYFSFQIQLFEGSNNINIVYGPCGTAATTTLSNTFGVGLTGAAVSDFNVRTTTTNWSATTAGGANSATCSITPSILPASGLTFAWSPPPVCSGTPTAGTTTAPLTLACYNASFTLNVSGATSGVTGLTYEWETSPDGITWTPTGVVTATYTVTQTTATQYRRRITCAGSDAWSTPISIGQNVVTQCYCIPVSSYGCADGDVIAQVILNTLDNNTGTGCPSDPTPGNQGINQNGTGYSDYTNYSSNPSLTTALQAGGSYSCTVYAGQYPEGYAAWIDYNDDGIFDNVTERIGNSNGQVAGSGIAGVLGSSASFPINLACNPPLGEHRLRIRAMYNTNGSAVVPCTNNSYGEVEDYLVTITTPVACPAPIGLAASNATTTSVDLAWTAGCVETAWDIEYGPTGFTPGTGTIVSVTGTPATTLSGLTGGTAYDFYVNADCGVVDGLSAQFGPVQGLTLAANDNCGSATDLATLTSPYTGSLAGTADDLDPCGTFLGGSDVVFSIDVADGNVLTIGQTSNNYDSYVSVFYGGACPGTTEITCFDDPDVQNIEWYNNTGSTQTVYWVQDAYSGAGTYTLAWTNVPAPTCGNPTASGIAPGAYNVTFTVNPNPLFGVASGYEYEIVPTTTTPTGVGTASATATVFGAGTLTASTTYDLYVRTDCGAGGFSNWVGPYTFTTTPPPPANDDCVNAIAVTCAGTPVSGTTVNSTLDFNYVNAGAGGSNTTERGVWYSLAGDDQAYTINTCSATSYDSRISVFSGTCGALVPITGNDDNSSCTAGTTLSSEVTFNAYTGTTYYILVHGYQFGTSLSTTGAFDMNISCSVLCLPIPGNDECANATVLTGSQTCTNTSGNNTCASPSTTLANPGAFSSFATLNDVWYTFTPTYADNSLTITNGTALQMGLAFYSGTCGAFTPLYSNANMVSGVPLNLTGFTIGVTYYVRVLSTVANAGTFDICVVEYPCATPTAATATATSNTTVDVAITGAAGDYIIEYGPVGFIPGSAGTAGVGGTIVSTSTLTTTVTVAADNNYDFYVRKDCSGTAEGYSFLTYAGSVTTYTVVPTTGSASITTCSATIYDSGTTGDYLTDCDGTLVIEPASASSILVLGGTYAIEDGVDDYLEVYEGVGTGGTLLATYNGTGTIAVQATAPNTALTVRFVSDWWNLNGPNGGFVITTSCQEVCTDIPSAAALTGNASVCPDQPVDIELVSPEIGLNYIWQKRTTSGGVWTTIAGETGPMLSTTQTVNTEYRARLNCDFYNNGGATVPTQSWFVTMNAPSACYCTPTYSSGTGFGDFIEAVSCGTINNVTGAGGSPYFQVFAATPTTTTTFNAGGQYVLNVTTGTYTQNDVSAWIDFNQSGSFEEGERLGQAENLGTNEVATFYFTVAPGATLGNTILRVREADTFGAISPCAPLSYGETEDYPVSIVAGVSNDAISNATMVSPPVYPACLNLSGNLALATDDPLDASTAADLWYSFVASSNACRIVVSGGTATNTEVEIQGSSSAFAPSIQTENSQSSNGNEILITDDLTAGVQYWVAVRNAGGVAGTFSICIQSLAASTCDNGPNFASLCSSFKADWAGTGSYTATFRSVSNPLNVYTYTTGYSSWIPLSVVPGTVGNPSAGGLQYGQSYDVTVASNFTLPNANGDAQSAVAVSAAPTCTISIAPVAAINMGSTYASTSSGSISTPGTNPRVQNSWIQTDLFVCGAIGYTWSVTEVDYLNASAGLPVEVITTSRQMRLWPANIPSMAAGKRYKVEVAPVFAWGTGTYNSASTRYLQIAGSAGMVAENNDNEVVLVDRTTETGVFASLYPNPSNGEMVNINIAGIESESVNIRIMDASGRTVWSNNFFVEGLLATTVNFDRPLAAGVYMVEMTYNGEVSTQRMIVQK